MIRKGAVNEQRIYKSNHNIRADYFDHCRVPFYSGWSIDFALPAGDLDGTYICGWNRDIAVWSDNYGKPVLRIAEDKSICKRRT